MSNWWRIILSSFAKTLLFVAMLVTAMMLLCECGVRKNTTTDFVRNDSTSVVATTTASDIKLSKVDTTKVTDEEITIKTIDFFAPTVVDGIVVADCIRSIREETKRKNETAKGCADNIEESKFDSTLDSTAIESEKQYITFKYTDTKAGTKRFFLAISSLVLLVLVGGLIVFFYIKKK